MLQHFIVLSEPLVNFIVVFELLSFEVLGILLDLTVEHVSLEIVLLVVLHQIDGVVDNLLLLFELAWMDNHQILTEVQLAHILAQTAVHRQGQRQLLLHLLLQVPRHLVLKQLLPTDPLLGVGLQHLPDQLLAHLRDGVYGSREVKVLLVDHDLQLVDVFGVVGRPVYPKKYLPKSIQ